MPDPAHSLSEHFYTRWQRLKLFIRDWTGEWGIAWSLARTNDCERIGGHFWKPPARDPLMGNGWWRECSKCGCSQSVAESTSTALGTLTIHLDATVTTAGFDTGQGGFRK